MRVCRSAFATVLLASFPLWLHGQGSGAVEGRAVNSITHLGIADVKVEVSAIGANDESLGIVGTDADGAFRMGNLVPGTYVARFQHDRYSGPQSDDIAEQPFVISAAPEPTRIGVELTPRSTLRGRLLDSDGRPMPGIRMQLRRLRYLGVYATDTDHEGRFVFENVRPTAYSIVAKPEDSYNVRPPVAGGTSVVWAPTYYPGVMDRVQAAPIAIPAGAELSGYEFRLAASPAFRVSGRVLDEAGAPVGHARVALGTDGLPGSEAIVSAGPDGRFEFPAVIPGWWRCSAETGGPPDYSSGPSVILGGWETKQRGSAALQVIHQDVDGLEIRVSQPFAVNLEVQHEDPGGPSPRPGARPLFLNALDTPGEMVGATSGASSGQLRFNRVFPGVYKVSIGDAEPGYYLAAVMVGEHDVLGREFELAPGAPAMRAVFRSRPGGVKGTVDGGSHATVVLLPRDEALRDLDATPRVQCQADGRFEIDGLRPGDYYAWAFDKLDADALGDASFVRTLLARAATVHVSRGEMAPLTLSVTLWPE